MTPRQTMSERERALLAAAQKIESNPFCECGYCEEHGRTACTGCDCAHGAAKKEVVLALVAYRDK